MKKRIDVVMVEQGLVRSRTLAGLLVREGNVALDGRVVDKPSILVEESANVEVIKEPPFVGRGGQKLEHALSAFHIDVTGMIAVDIGSSTGGFTDCLLKRGAHKVYAVDVGTGQLDGRLRKDPRVVVMEHTDIRKTVLPEKVDIAVIDVSFISLVHIFPALKTILKEKSIVIALIKPQFEVGQAHIGKQGVVRDEVARESAVETVLKSAGTYGLINKGVIPSPILGGSGNREYLAYFSFS